MNHEPTFILWSNVQEILQPMPIGNIGGLSDNCCIIWNVKCMLSHILFVQKCTDRSICRGTRRKFLNTVFFFSLEISCSRKILTFGVMILNKLYNKF